MGYSWVAVYTDGTRFCRDQDGVTVSSEQIDRHRLASFILLDENNKPIITQHLDCGQRLIYRRRVDKRPGRADIVCHLIGWQQTVGDTNIQHVAYVFEEYVPRIELAGRFRDDHPWFYAIHPVPSDAVEVQLPGS